MQRGWLIAITIIAVVGVTIGGISLSQKSNAYGKIDALSGQGIGSILHRSLSVHVIKSTAGLVKKGEHITVEKAGIWVPKTDVYIVGVSIPEQTDIDLYVDIEVSTNPKMYQEIGHIFRVKYAGPGLYDYSATTGSTYIGSNITTTNIIFPPPYAIFVRARTPICVHIDAINGSLIDVTLEQDCYLYYYYSTIEFRSQTNDYE